MPIRCKNTLNLSAFALHLAAMAFMLCDHLWATVFPGTRYNWLTCVGRMAYPIFAFLLVEGFHYTKSRKRYALRLLIFAVLSEIPFNLMYGGSIFYPFHQNVVWTFLLSFFCIWGMDRARQASRRWVAVAAVIAIITFGWLLGTIAIVDYYGAGVLTVLAFYLFRGRKWWQIAGQAIGMLWINCGLLTGLVYPVTIFKVPVEIPQQSFALISLVLIWMYRGRQGYHNRAVQLSCYAFYPVHMLVLYLMKQVLVIVSN